MGPRSVKLKRSRDPGRSVLGEELSEKTWIELEYTHLRAEILGIMGVEQAAIRFYVPAAATVYTVPYILKQTHEPYLWTVCTAAAGLLALGLACSLAECADSVRRIGSYIKEGIEPQTLGGLKWESVLYELFSGKPRFLRFLPSETFAISFSLMVANVAASLAAGHQLLDAAKAQWPVYTAAPFALLSCLSLVRIPRSSPLRERYTASIRKILKKLQLRLPALSVDEPPASSP